MSQEITGGDVLLSLIYQGGGGFALGFAAGYFLKKAMRILAFLSGALAVLLLLLAYSGIITVNWDKLALLVERALFSAQAASASLQSWILASLPFGGAFLAGAAIGFKYG
ncbi:MAG: hypothetical protein NZ902_04600 [Acidilobaceae archaeon]|nr:hypothetical protein [Acidilobaceae archaeon]MCX8164991.1 hypothetical protein [Acidilobaceae archaeon]MDW7974492.1 FUN14 domain-containing protein [Sulfolobales archaeon]